MTKTAQIWQEAAQLAEEHALRYGLMPRGCLQVLAQALREKAHEHRNDRDDAPDAPRA